MPIMMIVSLEGYIEGPNPSEYRARRLAIEFASEPKVAPVALPLPVAPRIAPLS